MISMKSSLRRLAMGAMLAAGPMLLAGCFEESGLKLSEAEISAGATPDWTAIAAWPGDIPEDANPTPNPDRVTTMLILDDSGSMSGSFIDAKGAVVDTLALLPEDGMVGVISLNRGTILPLTDVLRARSELPAKLKSVHADGGTPLGQALGLAQVALKEEAARQRGFGTYRIVVTTDGVASDEKLLVKNAFALLSGSPVELATIGLGIGKGHPLNMPGRTTYASIKDVSQLRAALKEATAEQASFDPLTTFEEVN